MYSNVCPVFLVEWDGKGGVVGIDDRDVWVNRGRSERSGGRSDR